MKTIADHILDICQNSIRAQAKLIEIIIRENLNTDLYNIIIRDDGIGMDEETARKATDAFFTSRKTRKIGLGLALLKQNAEQTGGSLQIISSPGKGTEVHVSFSLKHIDRPPVGNLAETLVLLMIGNEKLIFCYSHSTTAGRFSFKSSDLREIIGNIPLKTSDIKNGVEEFIHNNLDDLIISK
jgi:hypothetical protein